MQSFDDEAMRGFPSFWTWYGSQERDVTHFVCPFSGFPHSFPVLGSHILTVLSMDPVAIFDSSGAQETARTHDVWPLRVCFGVPVSQSKIRAVWSPLPVAMREDVRGENWVARMASPWPGIVDAHREIGRTLNTACGAAEMFWTSSVEMRPGWRRVL